MITAEDFAMVLVAYTVARLAQTFETIESKNKEDWIEEIHMACSSHNGAKVVLKVAEAEDKTK